MDERAGHTVITTLAQVTQDYVRSETPLSLTVTVPGLGDVACARVLRAIPGKRLVCTGTAGGKGVIVKLYYARRGASRHWKRSDTGCRAFIERGIPAPGICYSGYLPEYGIYALVLEYLEGGVRFDRALAAAGEGEHRSGLLDMLMAILACQHASGIIQNDLHLGNFMIMGHDVYSLDGDQVTSCRAPAGRRRSLDNLARMISNMPDIHGPSRDELVRAYFRERGWTPLAADMRSLQEQVSGIRRRNLSSYLGKVLRSRDPFAARFVKGTFCVFDKRMGVFTPDELLTAAGKSVPARGVLGKAGYRLFSRGDTDMMMLSARHVGPLMLKALSKPARIWRQALMLGRIGIRTPRTAGLVLRRKAPFLWEGSVFFMRVQGKPLKDFFAEGSIAEGVKAHVAERLADDLARMHEVGLVADLIDHEKILVENNLIVYLDPLAWKRPLFSPGRRQKKAIERFLQQCADIPEVHSLLQGLFLNRGLI